VTDSYYRTTDVFAKQNGMWLRVLHHVNAIPQGGEPRLENERGKAYRGAAYGR